MTTRNSDIATDGNQPNGGGNRSSKTVLIPASDRGKKYHKQLAGTFTACNRTHSEFEVTTLRAAREEYEQCVKCFQGGGV